MIFGSIISTYFYIFWAALVSGFSFGSKRHLEKILHLILDILFTFFDPVDDDRTISCSAKNFGQRVSTYIARVRSVKSHAHRGWHSYHKKRHRPLLPLLPEVIQIPRLRLSKPVHLIGLISLISLLPRSNSLLCFDLLPIAHETATAHVPLRI